jgi:hypothetical protein
MTIEDCVQLFQYIQKNNCWGMDMYHTTCELHRNAIKYVDASFDNRNGKIWKISFRNCTATNDKEFVIKSQDDIKTIYEWLDKTY